MDEHELWLSSLAEQRTAVRRAVSGLTEDQARSTPSASGLSLSVLVKHLTWGERTWIGARVGGVAEDEGAAGWQAGFALDDDETVPVLLQRWADVAAQTDRVVRAEPDLGRPVHLDDGTRQWLTLQGEATVRWVLLHVVEESARHAGHADVVRESIDGAGAWQLAQSEVG